MPGQEKTLFLISDFVSREFFSQLYNVPIAHNIRPSDRDVKLRPQQQTQLNKLLKYDGKIKLIRIKRLLFAYA